LALTGAISALAASGLSIGAVKSAHAEFQIQEATIEKGETDFEYRGAYHWGVPEATENNENANDLVQSHEFELEHAFTNWWLLQLTLGTEQPLHEDFNLSDVEIESEFALIKRKGDGIALSFQVGYEQAINHGEEKEASTIDFGPIVELASGKLLITVNPLFTGQVGPRARQALKMLIDLEGAHVFNVSTFGCIEYLRRALNVIVSALFQVRSARG
jgi:hypothetical protein